MDAYSAIALAGLELVNNVLKFIPNYEQKKVETFHKLRKAFDEERKKPRDDRNDEYLLNLADELCRYVQDFSQILASSSISAMHQAPAPAPGDKV